MKKVKVVTVATFTLTLLLFLSCKVETVKAWGPMTHIYITEQAIEIVKKQGTSELLNIILENDRNYAYFKCGLMFPDVTVIYYYTEWKSYQATHSWLRQTDMWELAVSSGSRQAMAFALGVGAHLLQDAIVHNYYIPNKIRSTLVLNNIIHPVVEGIVETKLLEIDKWLEDRTINSFAVYNVPFSDGDERVKDKTPIEFAASVIGTSLNWQTLSSQFNNILSGREFGASSFKGYSFQKQAGPLWDLYKGVAQVLKFTMSEENYKPYVDEAIAKTVEWLLSNRGGEPGAFVGGDVDPTGNTALTEADNEITKLTTAIIVLLILFVFFIYYRKYKSKKREENV